MYCPCRSAGEHDYVHFNDLPPVNRELGLLVWAYDGRVKAFVHFHHDFPSFGFDAFSPFEENSFCLSFQVFFFRDRFSRLTVRPVNSFHPSRGDLRYFRKIGGSRFFLCTKFLDSLVN